MDKFKQIEFFNACLNLAQLFPKHIYSSEASGTCFSGKIKASVELVYALHQLKERFNGTLQVTPGDFNLACFSLGMPKSVGFKMGGRTMSAKLIQPPLPYRSIR